MPPVDVPLLLEMARYAPLRTAIYSIGPPLWGAVQVVNAYLHGGAIYHVAAFALLLTALAVLLTRYHAAAFRRARLSRRLEG